MEAAAKSIKSLASVLPDRPHQLALSNDTRYSLPPHDTRLEEDILRPLQYMTYLFDVDRGILLTRAYSDIRDEESNAPKPVKPPPDPNKPRTKVSLQDYKRKKQETTSTNESNISTPKPLNKSVDKDRAPAVKKEESPSVDSMLKQATLKKAHPSLPPKPDVRRPGAEPSPDRKKRPSDISEDRPGKRTKVDGTPNGLSRVSSKSDTPSRTAEKSGTIDKKPSKELKPSPMPVTNGRSGLNNTGTQGVSPRPSSQINGSSQKSTTSKDSTSRKDRANSGAKDLKAIPMVSPIGPELGSRIPGYESSPKIKAADRDGKIQVKRVRDEPERSSTPRKNKLELPPLLSPTLPPVVREAQALADKKHDSKKESADKNALPSDSPGSAKKAPAKSDREETNHIEGKRDKKEESTHRILRLKYPKKLAKTISRLLALAPKKKPDMPRKDLLEPPKRDDHASRERSESLEPPLAGTARKRPRTATDVSEYPSAIKRPRTSEIAQPSTPSSRQTTAMQRVASSSSQAGTPGATTLTPAAPIPERRSASVDPERASRLREKHATLTALGTKLKHQRDRIIKPNGNLSANPSQRDRHALMATDLQSLVAYMAGFKAMDDMRDAERKLRDPGLWKSLMPLMRVYRGDCSHSNQLGALIMRLHCIALLWHGRSLVALGPDNAMNARELFQNAREQEQMWKLAGEARRRLDSSHSGDDGGPVARLIDRLGPWSTSEDVVGTTLKILHKVIRMDDEKFTPEPELTQACESATSGS